MIFEDWFELEMPKGVANVRRKSCYFGCHPHEAVHALRRVSPVHPVD